jgi:hypothetical protein
VACCHPLRQGCQQQAGLPAGHLHQQPQQVVGHQVVLQQAAALRCGGS